MGAALLRGALNAGVFAPGDVRAFDPDAQKTRELADELGIVASASPDELLHAEMLVLAVKPQIIERALEPLRELTPRTLLVSIAAGVSTQRLEACFPRDVPIVRAMPNTPALVGEGAAALCAGAFATPEHLAQARALFESVGVAVEVPENLLDAVTGLSGSGPAYVYVFIEALSDGGVRAGLPRDVATKLAAQTVLGAARMVLATGTHPGTLKDAVTSPGGTTIEALGTLEAGAFRGLVMNAVRDAARRSRELGG